MAYHKNTLNLEKMLLKFLGEPDPMLSMLEMALLRNDGSRNQTSLADKGEHSPKRTGYRWGPDGKLRTD